MRSYAVVTTCHAAGYAQYGQRMAETFVEQWPDDVPLLLYTEGFEAIGLGAQVQLRDLLASAPELVAFKARHAGCPDAHGHRQPRRRVRFGRWSLPLPHRERREPYRYDAVRFAHKTFAIFHAARTTAADVLIWIDADTRFFAPVTHAELAELMPAGAALACLRRPSYTECGFVAYDLRDPHMAAFLADFERFYTEDLFFAEREYHDSWLFDVARERAERRGLRTHDIAEGRGATSYHVLINSRLGRFMDHMKGDRKANGRSRADDLEVRRTESYWNPAD